MEIKEILALLEETINQNMDEFVRLGKTAKRKIELHEPVENIYPIYLKMADIVADLKPVESLIKDQNPRMVNLFDALTEIHRKTQRLEYLHNHTVSYDDASELNSFDL